MAMNLNDAVNRWNYVIRLVQEETGKYGTEGVVALWSNLEYIFVVFTFTDSKHKHVFKLDYTTNRALYLQDNLVNDAEERIPIQQIYLNCFGVLELIADAGPDQEPSSDSSPVP